MARELIEALAANVDRLLAAGGQVASADERLQRRARDLRELAARVPVLAQVADSVERVTASTPLEATARLLDLALVVRQLQAGLASAGVAGELEPLETSGPWHTDMPLAELEPILEELRRRSGELAPDPAGPWPLRWLPGPDLRTIEPALRSLRSKAAPLACLITAAPIGPTSLGPTRAVPGTGPELARREILASLRSSRLEGESVARAFVALLEDRDDLVREQAARLLGKMGIFADFVVPALAKMLQGGTANVRLAAIESLGTIGPKAAAAVPALKEAAWRERGEVGEAVVEALVRIGVMAAPRTTRAK
ncbi:MAG: HEAT repeat domain-containing protein [Gemmataceae bacterium]|nr:HEAT repeat domain-containing protein [Gemmataceae bacterium]